MDQRATEMTNPTPHCEGPPTVRWKMKNIIVTGQNKATGKYAALLYGYEETPSGSIRPLLLVSSEPIFDTPLMAARMLFDGLKPEVRQNTEMPVSYEPL